MSSGGALFTQIMNVIEKQFHRVLADQVYLKVFSQNNVKDGHVHFHISRHKDHLILLCSGSHSGKIISKSTSCRKGEYTPWYESSFSGFNRECILPELARKIFRVRIDCDACEMCWRGLDDFLLWLEE
jgi:hypothetical protein